MKDFSFADSWGQFNSNGPSLDMSLFVVERHEGKKIIFTLSELAAS